MRTHYALRLLSLQLADAGFHVLRFDYHGTGDSGGEVGPGQFAVWAEDVNLAARELCEISGAETLTLVALRTGAMLALEALALALHGPEVHGLVLWDPVVTGAAHLEALERMNAQMAARRSSPPLQKDELMGARYPSDLRAMMREIDLGQRVKVADAQAAALVVSEERPEYSHLLGEMRARWPATQYRLVPDTAQWDNLKAAFDARLTGPIVRAVAEAAEGIV
jgi:pimeloyl-ACP methyl ester carboxylesterase